MATYAIGDIQGCFHPLEKLLDQLKFDPAVDHLWLTGDLVNRGPQSLETLRLVKSLGAAAITVLGNHDLHLLALADGVRLPRQKDSLTKILKADDCDELMNWLRQLPLVHADNSIRTLMTHAGLYPLWDHEQLMQRAQEIENLLRSADYGELLRTMYGTEPNLWRSDLNGSERNRFIINALTRMRYCDPEGRLDFTQKGRPGFQGRALIPWFRHKLRCSHDWRIVFGHWSTLGFRRFDNVIALDSGCLWGGVLTAIRLDLPHNNEFQQVRCNKC